MPWLTITRLAPLIFLLAVAAAIDARCRRIPNWLTFGLLLAGLLLAGAPTWALGAASLPTVAYALLGVLVGGSIGSVMFGLGALGGGDVKLLAAIGAWVGPGPLVLIFMAQAIVGMLMVLAQAAYQGRTAQLFRNSALIAVNFAAVSEVGLRQAVETGQSCRSVARPLPYAVPVLIATLIVLSLAKLR